MIDGVWVGRTIVMDEVIPFHLTELLVSAQIPTFGSALFSYHFIILASKEVGDLLARGFNHICKQQGSSGVEAPCQINKELTLLLSFKMVNAKRGEDTTQRRR